MVNQNKTITVYTSFYSQPARLREGTFGFKRNDLNPRKTTQKTPSSSDE